MCEYHVSKGTGLGAVAKKVNALTLPSLLLDRGFFLSCLISGSSKRADLRQCAEGSLRLCILS